MKRLRMLCWPGLRVPSWYAKPVCSSTKLMSWKVER